jgi:hypothetical protein
VAGIDDAASVAIYGIVKSVMFSQDALWYQILQGPIAIVGGLGFGIMWGWLAKYVPEKGDVSTQSPCFPPLAASRIGEREETRERVADESCRGGRLLVSQRGCPRVRASNDLFNLAVSVRGSREPPLAARNVLPRKAP